MEVVGSEIGQKMLSAIKAKLTELGCYVDDELPDYVMVMVANKRTRSQMEDDLQLFLGDNTELFVNWLHQVLKKLQEVTVTTPVKPPELEDSKDSSKSKDKKSKEKKLKDKKKNDSNKKTKKKEKEKIKSHKKKEEKKINKAKKKNKHEILRPNIPPLLMNMEKDSEPSITDVFAGQILKNHGILLEATKDEPKISEDKPVTEIKRPVLPIIDPESITQPDPLEIDPEQNPEATITPNPSVEVLRNDQLKEMQEIEDKIQGLKQKLTEQLDSMSDDEDFLNIRTEAEELMNDFAEDVFQEISEQTPATPPTKPKTPPPVIEIPKPKEVPKAPEEILPQIELNLPKRPIRERLGAKDPILKVVEANPTELIDNQIRSPERFTPERDPEPRLAKRINIVCLNASEPKPVLSDNEAVDESTKKISKESVFRRGVAGASACASVVRVRPRPRVAPSSSLLLRAVADAHKSLLNLPPKPVEGAIKRALVRPMRRGGDEHIVIQVPAGPRDSDHESPKEEYIPMSLTKKIVNADYVPSRRAEMRTSTRKDDTLIVETINIHHQTVDKVKDTQFIVTMDGYHPNAFLAKKLLTEGLLDEDEDMEKDNKSETKTVEVKEAEKIRERVVKHNIKNVKSKEKSAELIPEEKVQKRLSNTSDESDTQVIIKTGEKTAEKRKSADETTAEKRKSRDETIAVKSKSSDERTPEKIKSRDESTLEKRKIGDVTIAEKRKSSDDTTAEKRKRNDETSVEKSETSDETTAEKRKSADDTKDRVVKKRKASPIVFDVCKKEKEVEMEPVRERLRERTESTSSDNHVTISTTSSSHKYDSLPPLSAASTAASSAGGTEKRLWCRSFPLCRFGAACAYAHPRCKFAASCTRRGCAYSHALAALPSPTTPTPVLSSQVVAGANYKSISATVPGMCKFYPHCANPTCNYFHPKPCRYGKACLNKLECNFYHSDTPAAKWKYPM